MLTKCNIPQPHIVEGFDFSQDFSLLNELRMFVFPSLAEGFERAMFKDYGPNKNRDFEAETLASRTAALPLGFVVMILNTVKNTIDRKMLFNKMKCLISLRWLPCMVILIK